MNLLAVGHQEHFGQSQGNYMNKICLNSRDELIIIDLDKVVCLQANGNYTNIVYVDGLKVMLSLGLSKMEDLIKAAIPKDSPSSFVRMGRSYIINQKYLSQINIVKQQIVLSDYGKHNYTLTIPKQLLKAYREIIRNKYNNVQSPNHA